MNILYTEKTLASLSKDELTQSLLFANKCLTCVNEEDFNNILLSFSAFLGFEFALYAYTNESYPGEHAIQLEHLSNPEEWSVEYNREGYLPHDPVRIEMERIMADGSTSAFILWDNYTWELSPIQQKVIDRRKHHGLHYGFSYFVDSESKDFTFLFSFADNLSLVTSKIRTMCELLAPHLMQARKRVSILHSIFTLSEKEKVISEWMLKGKTNNEIAAIRDITTHTVKHHIKNIFRKLNVVNRQQAISILLAARYLGP